MLRYAKLWKAQCTITISSFYKFVIQLANWANTFLHHQSELFTDIAFHKCIKKTSKMKILFLSFLEKKLLGGNHYGRC